jgi:hypothetical protein
VHELFLRRVGAQGEIENMAAGISGYGLYRGGFAGTWYAMQEYAETVGNSAFFVPFWMVHKEIQAFPQLSYMIAKDVAETLERMEFIHGKGEGGRGSCPIILCRSEFVFAIQMPLGFYRHFIEKELLVAQLVVLFKDPIPMHLVNPITQFIDL